MKPTLGVKDYDFMFKIILLGDNGVGKTTLLRRFTESKYHTQVRPHDTADVETKIIIRRNKHIKLHIWDTAGLERYQSLTGGYYRNTRGCVVLFDTTNENSFHNAAKWLTDAVRNCPPKSRILLAATKCQETVKRTVTRDRAENLAREFDVPYMEVGAQQNLNVNELFEALTDSVMDDMRIRALEQARSRRHLSVTISLQESLRKEFHSLKLEFATKKNCLCG